MYRARVFTKVCCNQLIFYYWYTLLNGKLKGLFTPKPDFFFSETQKKIFWIMSQLNNVSVLRNCFFFNSFFMFLRRNKIKQIWKDMRVRKWFSILGQLFNFFQVKPKSLVLASHFRYFLQSVLSASLIWFTHIVLICASQILFLQTDLINVLGYSS